MSPYACPPWQAEIRLPQAVPPLTLPEMLESMSKEVARPVSAASSRLSRPWSASSVSTDFFKSETRPPTMPPIHAPRLSVVTAVRRPCPVLRPVEVQRSRKAFHPNRRPARPTTAEARLRAARRTMRKEQTSRLAIEETRRKLACTVRTTTRTFAKKCRAAAHQHRPLPTWSIKEKTWAFQHHSPSALRHHLLVVEPRRSRNPRDGRFLRAQPRLGDRPPLHVRDLVSHTLHSSLW